MECTQEDASLEYCFEQIHEVLNIQDGAYMRPVVFCKIQHDDIHYHYYIFPDVVHECSTLQY